jgi:hypothetical protein
MNIPLLKRKLRAPRLLGRLKCAALMPSRSAYYYRKIPY